jgi:hypothetical protein
MWLGRYLLLLLLLLLLLISLYAGWLRRQSARW